MYECFNPQGTTRIAILSMGEADFWASLGYTVFAFSMCFRKQ